MKYSKQMKGKQENNVDALQLYKLITNLMLRSPETFIMFSNNYITNNNIVF